MLTKRYFREPIRFDVPLHCAVSLIVVTSSETEPAKSILAWCTQAKPIVVQHK